MKITFLLIIGSMLLTFSLKSQVTAKIEISNLKNSNGQILLELSDAEKNVINGISQEIVNNRCIITIENLSPGKYVFKYFHDENKNKEIDTNWLGIPKEGFGFSNNAKGTFGLPTHEKMIFELMKDTLLICKPIYINKK